MQNPIQKFRYSSIVFEKPGILSKKFSKLKTLTSSKVMHKFPTYQYVQKSVWDFFLNFV